MQELQAGPHYTEAIKAWLQTPGPADLDGDSYRRNQTAHHFACAARSAGRSVPPECQPLGLADGITAGSLAGRGWIPEWSFEGSWEDHTHGDKWLLLFLLRPVAADVEAAQRSSGEAISCEVEGTIVFSVPDGTLETCPAGHRSREKWERRAALGCGIAVELVRGHYDAAARQFNVLGVDTSDAGALQQLEPTLGLDNYKLSISPNGDTLNGLSRGDDRQGWVNELQAAGVQPLLVLARRQSLAWAMGLHERLCTDSVLADLPPDLMEMVLIKLYLSGKKSAAELTQDHAGRRLRVTMAKRAGIVLAEGDPEGAARTGGASR